VGSINDTRHSVTPDGIKISMFYNNRHFQRITLTLTMTNAAAVATLDNAAVISQLTNVISIQNKEVIESKTSAAKK
jgi:hypothetical protein